MIDSVCLGTDKEELASRRAVKAAEKEARAAEEAERNRPRTPAELLERYKAAFEQEMRVTEEPLLWVSSDEFKQLMTEMKEAKGSLDDEQPIPEKFHPVIAGLLQSRTEKLNKVSGALCKEIFAEHAADVDCRDAIADVVSDLAVRVNYGVKDGPPETERWCWDLNAKAMSSVVPKTGGHKIELNAVRRIREKRYCCFLFSVSRLSPCCPICTLYIFCSGEFGSMWLSCLLSQGKDPHSAI